MRSVAALAIAASFACDGAEPRSAEVQSAESAPAEALAVEIDACRELRVEALPEAANLVLVLSDTTRRDRLGAYGGPAATPSFDAFAREAILFEDAESNAPWTKPAVASLFTSRLPTGHGAVSHPRFSAAVDGRADEVDPRTLGREDMLVEELETLPEVLQRAGIRTGAIVSNPWIAGPVGFDQGFDHFDDSTASWDAPGANVTGSALDWLAQVGPGERFFLYVHYMSAHMPYAPIDMRDVDALGGRLEADGRPVTQEANKYLDRLWSFGGSERAMPPRARKIGLIEFAYDRGIAAFDTELGALLDALARREDWNRTAVVVTSDHGEALFERGLGGHGRSLHGDQLAIPLAARLPGIAMPQVVDCPVALTDLAPTVCSYLGVSCPTSFTGSSLLAPDANWRPRFLVSGAVMNAEGHRSIRNMRYKLIHRPLGPLRTDGSRDTEVGVARPDELYDLIADPLEERDLLMDRPSAEMLDLAARLRDALEDSIQRAPAPPQQTKPIDPERRQRLEALGYLDG